MEKKRKKASKFLLNSKEQERKGEFYQIVRTEVHKGAKCSKSKANLWFKRIGDVSAPLEGEVVKRTDTSVVIKVAPGVTRMYSLVKNN